MGKVQNAVQFHVDDGDVQVAERICQGREQNLNKKEIDSVTNRIRTINTYCTMNDKFRHNMAKYKNTQMLHPSFLLS